MTFCITLTLIFYISFRSLAKPKYLLMFLHPFCLCSLVYRYCKINLIGISFFFFLFISTKSSLPVWIRWTVCITKVQINLCLSISWMDFGLCVYHMVAWSNLNLLHNSQWIIFPLSQASSCIHFVLAFCIHLQCH